MGEAYSRQAPGVERLFDEGLLRLWRAPRNAAVLAQYIELVREMAEGGLRRV